MSYDESSLASPGPPKIAHRPRRRSLAVNPVAAEAVDFVMILTDTSAYASSKAKRFFRSMHLLRAAPARDETALIALLVEKLGRAGFRAVLAPRRPAEDASGSVMLLLTGKRARLQREYYREQLDAWIQSSSRVGEFTPREADPDADFSPARRIALLHAALSALLPELTDVLRGSDLLTLQHALPLHDRTFSEALLGHLTRHHGLAAQKLHALRNEYGEKVAFVFAFRACLTRWLLPPAACGALLWLAQVAPTIEMGTHDDRHRMAT
jgi:hypothetical protein